MRQTILLFCGLAVALAALAQDPTATMVGRYQKFELSFPAPVAYSNPYDPAVVDVAAVFTGPSGKELRLPGFYRQDYTRAGDRSKEVLTPIGKPCWRVRFAPSEIGAYRYTVTLKDANGTRALGKGAFSAIPSASHGFVRARGQSFVFDDGTPYYPIGVNAPWFQYRGDLLSRDGSTGQWGVSTFGAENMFKMYEQVGANWVHFWICSTNSTVENAWAHPSIGCSDSRMSQPDSWAMDYIMDLAQKKGIYFLPILKFKNQKIVTPEDHLLFRYAVARWGYSTSIFGWEFCKEGGVVIETVDALARDMQSLDPYNHLRTSSLWNRKIVPGIYGLASIDVAQLHDYPRDCAPGADRYEARMQDLGLYLVDQKITGETFSVPGPFIDYGKPFFVGETGLQMCNSGGKGEKETQLYDIDKSGEIFHEQVWGMVMATSGAYSPWYYRFDRKGQWTNLSAFKGIAGYYAVLTSALKGTTIPDSAKPFTNFRNAEQAKTSDPRLSVTGRKNARFAMLRIQNLTTTWAAVLRDKKTPELVSGTVALTGFEPGDYTVRWCETAAGKEVRTEQVKAATSALTFNVVDLKSDITAIVTR